MIDLRSDTVTTPTEDMRGAAAHAEVGDDVFGEDPTVNQLETTAANLVGMEAALFVPSGTMGNQVAALAHTTSGQQILVEKRSHISEWESHALITHGGLSPLRIEGGPGGLISSEQLLEVLQDRRGYQGSIGMIGIENTHNRAGGVAHHPDTYRDLAQTATSHDIPVHLDGARLFNAAVALGIDPATLASPADSVMFCLSKGLGAPIGSIVAGPSSLIDQAREYRRRLGGGMRQVGVIAAPGLISLRSWDHLATDHHRAQRLARGINRISGLTANTPDTNIVLVDVSDLEFTASSIQERFEAEGVLGFAVADDQLRLCTHRDLDDQDIDRAIEGIARAVTTDDPDRFPDES